MLERGCGSLQVPTGCASHEGSRPFSWPLVRVVSVGSRLRGEVTPSPDKEQACCARGEALNAVPLGHNSILAFPSVSCEHLGGPGKNLQREQIVGLHGVLYSYVSHTQPSATH